MFVSSSLYRDAFFLLLGDNSDRSRHLVKEFLEASDKESGRKEITSSDDDLILVYKNLISTVMMEKVSQDNPTSLKILLLRVRSIETFKNYPLERDLLSDVLTAQDPITAVQIDGYLKRLRNTLLLSEMDVTHRKIFAKSRTVSEIQDVSEQEEELLKLRDMLDNSLKSMDQRQSHAQGKASESYVSMSDADSLRRAIGTYMDRSVRGILRSGLQGLNRSLGARGGLGLGETAVFAASSHNYKSGILVSWMLWAIIYNKIEVQPGKRAMVYFISLENEVHQNLMIVFKTLYCRVEKRHVDFDQLTEEFIVEWILNYFKQFNVELFIDRYTPHEFSFGLFTKRYNSFVEQGYEIILFDLDYMSEARGVDPGDTFSLQGQIQLIKENYQKFVNHAKQCGYTLTTGHQLTKKAEEIAGQYPRGSVRKFNPSMMADSSDVHRTVDVLFFMQLETNLDGFKFLTMINRKNRGNLDTPEKDKFFAYPFTEFGIEDDLLGAPAYLVDIDGYGQSKAATGDQIVEGAMF